MLSQKSTRPLTADLGKEISEDVGKDNMFSLRFWHDHVYEAVITLQLIVYFLNLTEIAAIYIIRYCNRLV